MELESAVAGAREHHPASAPVACESTTTISATGTGLGSTLTDLLLQQWHCLSSSGTAPSSGPNPTSSPSKPRARAACPRRRCRPRAPSSLSVSPDVAAQREAQNAAASARCLRPEPPRPYPASPPCAGVAGALACARPAGAATPLLSPPWRRAAALSPRGYDLAPPVAVALRPLRLPTTTTPPPPPWAAVLARWRWWWSGAATTGRRLAAVGRRRWTRASTCATPPEQVEALERVYSECPKPSSLRRQQLIRECPILSTIEPKHIKVWFQNRSRQPRRREGHGDRALARLRGGGAPAHQDDAPGRVSLIVPIVGPTVAAELVELTLLANAREKGAVCLAGSPPAYQLRIGFGSGSQSWLVNLEGGAWCNTTEDCSSRSLTDLGLPKFMKPIEFEGMLSNNHTENPYLYNWNIVDIRYCDGGHLPGTQRA
ncbi:uncharacterized protein [Miscanthus floridulus]|uniref:uncharacterized protein n=1 Tax=Miscanthus floridulus TaxID=154761 RepID=UPI00345A0403